MAHDPRVLDAVPVPGLHPDRLGNYLASLGLLRVLARKWPRVRIAWREHVLHTVGGPATIEELLDELMTIAERRAWTPYARVWADAQKKSSTLASNKKTSTQSGLPFALWAAKAEEEVLEVFSAHVVPAAAGRTFNPALGNAGKIGQRDFAIGWSRAVEALAPPAPSKPGKSETPNKIAKRLKGDSEKAQAEANKKRVDLGSLLRGEPHAWMEKDLNAACWFSDANKLYNNGQTPFRDGLLSPWAMALACEGLVFLAGGASRRLGSRVRGRAAFPFVTQAVAPVARGELGRDSGEIWAPVWDRPMTVPEVVTLFQRGRAEIFGRGVLTPSAFATAILRRGVDAGIVEFRRFILGWTTAQDYMEPRFVGVFNVREPFDERTSRNTFSHTPLSTALDRMLRLIDRLPRDTMGRRSRFVGLRGPLEAALLQLAVAPEDSESAQAVVDAAVETLDRVDRNRSFRKPPVFWEPCPIEWLPSLFRDDPPNVEARLALALVSGFPASRPFTLYRFGVERKHHRFEHSERPPARWVWGPGPLSRVLSTVLQRRTLDWESARKETNSADEPARFVMPATSSQVSRWLDGALDEALLARWISRLALFDWYSVPREVRTLAMPDTERPETSAPLCLFGLIHPLFDHRPVHGSSPSPRRDLLSSESGARTPGAARTLAALIRTGQLDVAVRFASSRYSMAGTPLLRTNVLWRVADPERLLASILFPIADHERSELIGRWLRPQRYQGEKVHA